MAKSTARAELAEATKLVALFGEGMHSAGRLARVARVALAVGDIDALKETITQIEEMGLSAPPPPGEGPPAPVAEIMMRLNPTPGVTPRLELVERADLVELARLSNCLRSQSDAVEAAKPSQLPSTSAEVELMLQAAQERMFEDAMFKAGRRAFSTLRALESGDFEIAKQDMRAIEGLAVGTRPR
jgi:hypothetical protein